MSKSTSPPPQFSPSLRDRIRTLTGIELAELAGATLTCQLPLTNATINRLIHARLAKGGLPVTSAEIDVRDGDLAVLTVSPSMPLPAVRIELRIELQPDFPGNKPVLWLRWSMGGFASFLSKLVDRFKPNLPPGVKMDSELIAIDLAEILRAQNLGELVPYIKNVRVHTKPGAFVVQVDAAL
jgi:hypothetical protein